MASMSFATQSENHWVFHTAGQKVSQIVLDYGVSFQLESEVLVRIEAPFVLRTNSQEQWKLTPGDGAEEFAPILSALHSVAGDWRATDDGRLELSFFSGISIEVLPSSDYEAWQIVAPDGARYVGGPGARVTAWSGVALH